MPRAESQDIRELSALLRSRRGKRGLREVAKEVHVSAATLSRVEQGRVPDLKTFNLICKWLGVEPSRFFGDARAAAGKGAGSGTRKPPSTMTVIEAHLRADPDLSPDTAEELSKMVKLMYDRLKRGGTTAK